MSGLQGLDQRPFIVLAIMFLAWLNQRCVLATLSFSLGVTTFAFNAIIFLFLAASPLPGSAVMRHQALIADLPSGWSGVLAAVHFGLWFDPGI